MSLLLQALQKAAKNRESNAPPSEPSATLPAAEPVETVLPSIFALDPTREIRNREPELALAEEDLFETDELDEVGERFEPFEPSPDLSDRAATVLRASESNRTGWLDRIRDRPVHAFAGLAGVFGAMYGVYVYLQIAHPAMLRGEFFSKPIAVRTPPSTSSPTTAIAQTRSTSVAPIQNSNPANPIPAASQSAPGLITGMGTKPTATLPLTTPATVAAAADSAADTTSVKEPDFPATMSVPSVRSVRPVPLPTRLARQRRVQGATFSVDTAREQINSSAAIQPSTSRIAPGLNEAYDALQDGRLDQAESLYRGVMQTDGQNIDAILGLGGIAVRRGESQQAIGFYERALELEPRNPVAQAGLITLLGQADPQMSETRLKQLIAREPSGFLHFSLGNLYSQQNQWPAAQQAYFQAYEMQPNNSDYAYNLAIGLEHLGQSKLALLYYRKAIDLSFQKGHANFDQKRVIERIGQLSAQTD
ncbi:MAG: tetratricopeptide repeat protein [Betaproteobacteria bacterium]